ncbi:MAG: Maf family protein [Alphaproteobacteria bacterium]
MTGSKTIWSAKEPLILASQSTIRAELLKKVGFPFSVETADIDERKIENELNSDIKTPQKIALALAEAKALAVSQNNPDAWVIGADQTLEFENNILHKVAKRQEAETQLLSMSGKTHELHSAIAVVRQNKTVNISVDTAFLNMRPLSRGDIQTYCDLAGDVLFQSVGCYQFEGLGRHLFASVDGQEDVILGLPLSPIIKFFRSAGCLTF